MSVARIIAAMGGIRLAAFITEHHYATTGANQDVSVSGAQAGDLAIIFAVNETSLAGLSGWTSVGQQTWGASRTDVYSKALSSADISAGKVTVTGTGNGGIIAIAMYRGATAVAITSSATGSTSSLAVPGFTKSQRSASVLTFVANGVASGGTIAAPTGTTARVAPFGSGILSGALADVVPAALYANGTALTWTGLTATANNAGGMILELT